MSNRSYMPFFVTDYLADTAHLSRSEHGAYLLLIMAYWMAGEALPENDQKLAKMAHATHQEWSSLKLVIADFFTVENGKWHHKRIDNELRIADEKDLQRKKLSEERKEYARRGGLRSAEKREEMANLGEFQAKSKQMLEQMPSKIEADSEQELEQQLKQKSTIKAKAKAINININTRNSSENLENIEKAEEFAPAIAVADGDKDNLILFPKQTPSPTTIRKRTEEDQRIGEVYWNSLIKQGGINLTKNDSAIQAKAMWRLVDKTKAQFGTDAIGGATSMVQAFLKRKAEDRSASGFWRTQPTTPLALSGETVWGQVLESIREPAMSAQTAFLLKELGIGG